MAVTGAASAPATTNTNTAINGQTGDKGKKKEEKIRGTVSEESSERVRELADDPKNKERIKSQKMDGQAFFKLMLEQLKNQDPMSPMNNNDMLNQMSQLSAMGQMEEMAKASLTSSQTIEGLAKEVSYLSRIVETKDNKDLVEEIKRINQKIDAYFVTDNKKPNADEVADAINGSDTGESADGAEDSVADSTEGTEEAQGV